MSIFTDIIGGTLKKVKDAILPFVNTADKKNKLELSLKAIEADLNTQLEMTYRIELESRAKIIQAEMEHGNSYTKNARPTIVYAGLVFIALINVILPMAAYIIGTPADEMPDIKLPSEFWFAWGTVTSVWSVGRSAEKRGVKNKITKLMTGSA